VGERDGKNASRKDLEEDDGVVPSSAETKDQSRTDLTSPKKPRPLRARGEKPSVLSRRTRTASTYFKVATMESEEKPKKKTRGIRVSGGCQGSRTGATGSAGVYDTITGNPKEDTRKG